MPDDFLSEIQDVVDRTRVEEKKTETSGEISLEPSKSNYFERFKGLLKKKETPVSAPKGGSLSTITQYVAVLAIILGSAALIFQSELILDDLRELKFNYEYDRFGKLNYVMSHRGDSTRILHKDNTWLVTYESGDKVSFSGRLRSALRYAVAEFPVNGDYLLTTGDYSSPYVKVSIGADHTYRYYSSSPKEELEGEIVVVRVVPEDEGVSRFLWRLEPGEEVELSGYLIREILDTKNNHTLDSSVRPQVLLEEPPDPPRLLRVTGVKILTSN